MVNKAAVFDFDGTIADSEKLIIDMYDYLASKNNRPKVDEATIKKLRDGTPREAIKWAGIKIWQIPGLLKMARVEYEKHSSSVKIFAGMEKVISEVSKEYDVYILSTNSNKLVKSILEQNNFKPEMKILKRSSFFGKAKILKKLLKQKRYIAAESWKIGDEFKDIDAGNKANMQTIGVTWGLQSEKGLSRANPSFIVNSPKDLLKLLK